MRAFFRFEVPIFQLFRISDFPVGGERETPRALRGRPVRGEGALLVSDFPPLLFSCFGFPRIRGWISTFGFGIFPRVLLAAPIAFGSVGL